MPHNGLQVDDANCNESDGTTSGTSFRMESNSVTTYFGAGYIGTTFEEDPSKMGQQCIWNTELTATQIKEIYLLGPKGNWKTSYSTGMVGYWTMGNNNLSGEIPGDICNLTIDWSGVTGLIHGEQWPYFDVSNNNLCPPYLDCGT